MKRSTIWKFPIDRMHNELLIPFVARVLCAQFQGTVLCMWALVDPDSPKEKRVVHVVGTGEQIVGDLGEYIGTVQQGPLVWHVFLEARE